MPSGLSHSLDCPWGSSGGGRAVACSRKIKPDKEFGAVNPKALGLGDGETMGGTQPKPGQEPVFTAPFSGLAGGPAVVS